MKYKKERYINQRQTKHGWTFQVIIRKDGHTITESFSETEYGSARLAFDCALNFRNKTLADLSEKKYFPKTSIMLSQLFEESEDLSNINAKTKRNHLTLFNRYIGDIKLDDFTSEFMIKKLNDISYSLSDDTISRVFHLFKRMDETAILKHYYAVPRCIGFKAPRSHKIIEIKEARITDKDTVKTVYENCADKSIKGIIAVAYYTGMRPAEIYALGKKDIKNGYIYVNKQIGSDKEEEGVVTTTKNNYSTRMIPISPFLEPILEAYKGSVLFPNVGGDHFSSNTFNARTAPLFRPYNLSLYKLRHLFATTLEYEGVDRPTIYALMGHTPKNSTDVYIHSNKEKMKKAVMKIPDFLGD